MSPYFQLAALLALELQCVKGNSPRLYISDELPFLEIAGALGSLWSAGQPSGGFSCDVSVPSSSLEGPEIDVRRFVLDTSSPVYAEPGDAEAEATPTVLRSANVEASSPRLLVVAVEPALASGSPADLADPILITVQYHCRSEGEARVTLRLVVATANSAESEICVSWTKACTVGFAGLVISEGSEKAIVDGALDPQWQQRMQHGGTSSSSSQLLISYPRGVLRLQPPAVDSDQQFLSIDVRGPFLLDGDAAAFEVSSEPAPLTALYTCDRSGTAEVLLTLTKDVLGSADEGEKIELRWRKHCGLLAVPQLKVQLWSDTFHNRTAAVEQGEVASQFRGVCKHKSKGKTKSGSAGTGVGLSSQAGCHVVPATDFRTTLELSAGDDGHIPDIDPPPIVTVDPRVVKVTVGPAKDQVSRRARSIDMKYVCFRDTTTTILVTLHMPSHRPVDITWVKVCKQPKNKVGRAFTAKHAVTLGLIIVAAIAITSFVCLFFCDETDAQEVPKRQKASPDFDCELDDMSAETVGRAL